MQQGKAKTPRRESRNASGMAKTPRRIAHCRPGTPPAPRGKRSISAQETKRRRAASGMPRPAAAKAQTPREIP